MSSHPPRRALPARPDLDHQRRLAKALLAAARAGEGAAVERFRVLHPRWSELAGRGGPAALKLADAQLVVAREYGFPSWSRLKAHIDEVTGAADGRCRPFETDLGYYRDRAAGLLSSLQAGDPRALRLVRRHHPAFADADDAAVGAAGLSQADAELVLAREHGFEGWDAFAAHIAALAAERVREPFRDAFRAMKAGDARALAAVLGEQPALVNARGTNGNRLLTLAVSLERAELVRLLLEAGADPDLPNDKGWTPLHAAAYGSPEGDAGQAAMLAIMELLLDAGASIEPEAHGEGGTPLVVALFWGHRSLAERLAREGVVPRNLRVAAGLGDLGLMRELFGTDDRSTPEAGARRGFHRPHSGFPVWRPSDDPQEVLDEALVYAAKSGRHEAMALLLERGAGIDAEPCNGTALHWAAARDRADTVAWLLERGASIDRRAGFGGTRSVTALHVAAGWGGSPAAARVLAERGADLHARDAQYDSSPLGWAEHFGNRGILEELIEIGSRRDVFAAVRSGRLERVATLLEAEPGLIDARDVKGGTPLDLARSLGQTATVTYLESRAIAGRRASPGAGERLLHLRCGSDIRDKLRAAGLLGDFLEFADPVCQGPVPGSVPEAELRRLRARFIAEAWRTDTYDAVLARLEQDAAALDAIDRYDRIVLWFEHDLHDQSVLIRLLAGLRDRPALHDRLFLISVDSFPGVERFVGLGQLTPEQLGSLWGSERPVTRAEMDLAARAWAAFTGDDPRTVQAIADGESPELPFLARALRRQLRDLPWTADGLSLTERLSLRAIAEGAGTPGRAFGRLHRELEPLPHLGDAMWLPILRALADAAEPAVTPFDGWRDPVRLTGFGHALLEGEADWVAANGIDRWLGGLHLEGPAARWRWDEAAGRPVAA